MLRDILVICINLYGQHNMYLIVSNSGAFRTAANSKQPHQQSTTARRGTETGNSQDSIIKLLSFVSCCGWRNFISSVHRCFWQSCNYLGLLGNSAYVRAWFSGVLQPRQPPEVLHPCSSLQRRLPRGHFIMFYLPQGPPRGHFCSDFFVTWGHRGMG